MKVILKANIPKLGVAGEVCEVKRGYAKNYLLPQGLAVLATSKALKKLEVQKKEIEKRKIKEKKEFENLLKKIAGISLKIKVPTGEKQEMFAAIHTKDITHALEEQKKIKLDSNFINLSEPIKKLGEYKIEVDFGEGMKTNFLLIIEEEK